MDDESGESTGNGNVTYMRRGESGKEGQRRG